MLKTGVLLQIFMETMKYVQKKFKRTGFICTDIINVFTVTFDASMMNRNNNFFKEKCPSKGPHLKSYIILLNSI